LLVDSKEIGLEVNAETTKYMVMFWDKNGGQDSNWLIDWLILFLFHRSYRCGNCHQT
jgi:hypothetical protein